jgi:EAL domain-containing protein (putative c-di-GMP-specific phosphodiesterase class I)
VCALDEVIRRAIRGGELALAYQPVVDLISGSIVGFECLLRWNHPRLGMLPAREFIADFERSAAMAEVDCWVVAEALGQASAWAAAVGNPVRVFVNICPSTLEDWASVGKILEVLRTAALPAGCLDLEITERVAPGRRQHFLESCWLLKEQGIGFTLDDFGTGHSGLELLAELPAGFVKLDRRLAAGLGEPSRVAGWVGSTLVELATALDAATIAEGMEEPEQLEAARRAGCYAGQGYLLGAPLPADTASDLLAAA